MIVLCYGMLKSGSTLAFELCKAVLEVKGFVQRRLPDTVVRPGHSANFIGKPSPEQLLQLQAAVAPQEIIAIKLHAPLPAETRADFLSVLARREMRLHVNFRDPREICLSLLDAGIKARQVGNATTGFGLIHTLADAARFIEHQIAHCVSWGSIPEAVMLHYNDVAFDSDPVIDRLCADLGFGRLNASERAAVKDRTFNSATTLKNKAVRNRHRLDLAETESEWLLDAIEDSRVFVQRVCEQRDYGWLAARWRERTSAAESFQ